MSGFYRVDPSGELLIATDGIATPTGEYVIADKDKYAYPIDGAWRWFDSETEALVHFAGELSREVPTKISAVQARRALLAAGLLESVEAAVAQAAKDVQVAWEYATMISRDDKLVTSIAGALGIDNDRMDALFAAGAAIK